MLYELFGSGQTTSQILVSKLNLSQVFAGPPVQKFAKPAKTYTKFPSIADPWATLGDWLIGSYSNLLVWRSSIIASANILPLIIPP